MMKFEVLKYLKEHGVYRELWPFPSGGKIPDSIPKNKVSPAVKEAQVILRKELGMEPRVNLTWGDLVLLLPKFQSLRFKNWNWIKPVDQTISIKLGPTFEGSNEYLFSIDLDCKDSWVDQKPFDENLRQEFLDTIVDRLFKTYGPTLVTSSRSNGRHIIYKTNIPQTTKITNSTNMLMGLYWNNDPYFNFSVDYKTSPDWKINHHTTIYGDSKDGGYFGIIENNPILLVRNLQTNALITHLVHTKHIKYSKEMQLKRSNIKRLKTTNSKLGGGE